MQVQYKLQISSNLNKHTLYYSTHKAFVQVRHKIKKGLLLHAVVMLEVTISSGLNLPKDWICPWTALLYNAAPCKAKIHTRIKKQTGASGAIQSLAKVFNLLSGRQSPRARSVTGSSHHGRAAWWPNEAVGSFPAAADRRPTSRKTVTAIGINWRSFLQAQQGKQGAKRAWVNDCRGLAVVPLGVGACRWWGAEFGNATARTGLPLQGRVRARPLPISRNY